VKRKPTNRPLSVYSIVLYLFAYVDLSYSTNKGAFSRKPEDE